MEQTKTKEGESLDPDDLDDILESALDDFDEEEDKPKTKTIKSKSTSTTYSVSSDSVQIKTEKQESVVVEEEVDEKEEQDELAKLMESLKTGDFEKTIDDIAKSLQLDGNSGELPDMNLNEETIGKIMEDFEKQPDMMKMVEQLMGTFVSKDVMYEPMKEMRTRYPKWFEENTSKLSSADLAKYQKQFECVKKMCDAYENDPQNTQKIITLMHEMQETGQPPADILKELTDVLGGGGELPALPTDASNCSIM